MLIDPISNIKLNIYYDETNNARKFYLTNDKEDYINSEVTFFVLGGVATSDCLSEKPDFNHSLEELFKKLGLQKTQKELKFKHIANGNFETILSSKKLNTVFDFFIKNDIIIHMHVLDTIYWSVVDIVDSQSNLKIIEECFSINQYILHEIKSFLTDIAKTFKRDFFKELFELGYPNIISKKQEFINCLTKYLTKFEKNEQYHKNNINSIVPYLLKTMIEEMKKDDSDAFCFLENEPKHELIDNFNNFYEYNIKTFPNSKLFFDREVLVEKFLKEYLIKYTNYKFLESKESKLIQLSDITIGFIRHLFLYTSNLNYKNIEKHYKKLNKQQKDTLNKFFTIYQKSVTTDRRLTIFTTSFFDWQKFNKLMDLATE